jgi:hypothetical protein
MGTRRTIAIGLIATAVLALASIAARAQTKWDLSTVWPDGNFHTKNAMRFAQEVGKATNGSVEITVKAGGQLGFKGPEHLRAVRDGLVPMADVLNIQPMSSKCCTSTYGPSTSRSLPETIRRSSTWCHGRRSICTSRSRSTRSKVSRASRSVCRTRVPPTC